jgi:hypothetical protein
MMILFARPSASCFALFVSADLRGSPIAAAEITTRTKGAIQHSSTHLMEVKGYMRAREKAQVRV